MTRTAVFVLCLVAGNSVVGLPALAQGSPAGADPIAASPSAGDDDAAAANAPSDDAAPGATAAEGAEGEAKPLPLPSDGGDGASDDSKAPLIEDVAVAASSPTTAPMITAVITDDWSGVERADVYFRRSASAAYEKTALNPGTGGLFIARLPDGTQTTGFEYYLEVWDAAENGPSRMGAPEAPLVIPAAEEGTVERLEREQTEREMGPVHPAWMMLSLGGGVLAAAGAGVFWLDYVNLQSQIAAESDPARRVEIEEAALGDAVLGSVLGVVAAAGLVTGVSLLVYSALEE